MCFVPCFDVGAHSLTQSHHVDILLLPEPSRFWLHTVQVYVLYKTVPIYLQKVMRTMHLYMPDISLMPGVYPYQTGFVR